MDLEQYLGEIRMFAGDYAPDGWALCEGQELSIGEFQPLYSLIGTTYGGNGRTTFKLPDLRGRAPLSYGQAPGLSKYELGTIGGDETVVLDRQHIGHAHQLMGTAADGSLQGPAGNVVAGGPNAFRSAPPNVELSGQALSPTGGGQPHENRQPYLCINYVIALYGDYPQS